MDMITYGMIIGLAFGKTRCIVQVAMHAMLNYYNFWHFIQHLYPMHQEIFDVLEQDF